MRFVVPLYRCYGASPPPFLSASSFALAASSFALAASFIYGSGSIFIIIWNASVWGVVFGTIARNAATHAAYSPFGYLLLSIIAVTPHLATEASAYILAAISGGIVSKAVIMEKLFSERFMKIIKDAFVIFIVASALLLVAAYIESNVTSKLFQFFGL